MRNATFIQGVSNKRFVICTGLLSLWFDSTLLTTIFSRYEEAAKLIPLGLNYPVLFGFVIFVGLWIMIAFATKYFQKFVQWCEKKSYKKAKSDINNKILSKINLEFNKKSVFRATLVIVIFWTPWIILSYPSIIPYDTMNQIYQFQSSPPTYYTTTGVFVDSKFIDHHPVFLSLVYGSVMWIGDAIGSQNVAVFIFCLAQTLLLAAILGICVCYLSELNVPLIIRRIALFCISLFGVLPIITMQLLKDSTFSVFYVAFFLLFLMTIRSKGLSLKNIKFLVLFTLAALLCCLTRKTGFYIIVISLIIAVFLLKKYKIRLLSCLFACLITISVIMPCLVYPAIGGVERGTSQEFFGMFYQQITAVANKCDDLSDEEKQNVNAVFDLEKAKTKFKKTITDPVKSTANKNVGLTEQLNFMKSWVSIGIRHPDVYFSATMCINSPMLSPGLPITFYKENGNDFYSAAKKAGAEDIFHVNVEKPETLKSLYESFCDKYIAFVSCPYNVLSVILLHRGVWTSWYIAAAICMLVMFKKKEWTAFIPAILLLLTFIIGPVAAPRYSYPSLFCGVLTLGLLTSAFCKNKNQKRC